MSLNTNVTHSTKAKLVSFWSFGLYLSFEPKKCSLRQSADSQSTKYSVSELMVDPVRKVNLVSSFPQNLSHVWRIWKYSNVHVSRCLWPSRLSNPPWLSSLNFQIDISCILGGINRVELHFPHLISYEESINNKNLLSNGNSKSHPNGLIRNGTGNGTAGNGMTGNGIAGNGITGNGITGNGMTGNGIIPAKNHKLESISVPWMPCSVMASSLFLGSLEQARNPKVIKSLGITHIVSIGRWETFLKFKKNCNNSCFFKLLLLHSRKFCFVWLIQQFKTVTWKLLILIFKRVLGTRTSQEM